MLLQTNSYVVPKDKRAEHARLMRRFRQILNRLGCDDFEIYEQVGANWGTGQTSGRFVQLMRFRDRRHQLAVQTAERDDQAAQELIAEFCALINYPLQQQQQQFAVGFYSSVLPVGPSKPRQATGAVAADDAAAAGAGGAAAAVDNPASGDARDDVPPPTADAASFGQALLADDLDAAASPVLQADDQPAPAAVVDERADEEATHAEVLDDDFEEVPTADGAAEGDGLIGPGAVADDELHVPVEPAETASEVEVEVEADVEAEAEVDPQAAADGQPEVQAEQTDEELAAFQAFLAYQRASESPAAAAGDHHTASADPPAHGPGHPLDAELSLEDDLGIGGGPAGELDDISHLAEELSAADPDPHHHEPRGRGPGTAEHNLPSRDPR